MTIEEAKQYITAILNTFDSLSKTGGLQIRGIAELQQFSGCLQALTSIKETLGEENKGEAFK